MIWLSIISALIFIFFSWILVRNFRIDPVEAIAFIVKILAGIAVGLVYTYYYNGGDTFRYYVESGKIARFLIENPSSVFPFFFDTASLPELMRQISFQQEPRALFFTKIVALFHLFTGGNYWLMGMYMSLGAFLAVRFLVRELGHILQQHKSVAKWTFYFLPTFIFWTSGVMKETLAFATIAVLTGIVIRFDRDKNYTNLMGWVVMLLTSLLLWKLKYFYAAVALPLAVVLLLYNFMKKRYKIHVAIIPLLFIGVAIVVSRFHYNLRFEHILQVVYENYQTSIAASCVGATRYHHFDGSLYGFLINFPLALFSGLFRPFIFEFHNTPQLVVALENFAIFILFVTGLWKGGRRIFTKNPYVIVAIVYVAVLAVFIAFSTPNFGTMSRYKVAYWPFFVMLVLLLIRKIRTMRLLAPNE